MLRLANRKPKENGPADVGLEAKVTKVTKVTTDTRSSKTAKDTRAKSCNQSPKGPDYPISCYYKY